MINNKPDRIDGYLKEWYKDGQLHRDDDKPAVIYDDPMRNQFCTDYYEEWYQHGQLHRDNDKPAVLELNGYIKRWYQNGIRHRDNDKPAIIHGSKEKWYQNDKLHRDNDKPAIICANGSKHWYKNGQRHRDNDKPAVIYKDFNNKECKEWWWNGLLIKKRTHSIFDDFFVSLKFKIKEIFIL